MYIAPKGFQSPVAKQVQGPPMQPHQLKYHYIKVATAREHCQPFTHISLILYSEKKSVSLGIRIYE